MGDPVEAHRWKRIADDLLATTGRVLLLDVRRGNDGWCDVDVSVDGKAIGSFGRSFPVDDEGFLAALADYLCEFAFDGQVGAVWPVCIRHGTHPMQARLDEDHQAVWSCPMDRTVAHLGQLPPPMRTI